MNQSSSDSESFIEKAEKRVDEWIDKSLLVAKTEFLSFLKKNADRTYRDIFKDIEISRKSFLNILLGCFSVSVLIALSINYFTFIIDTQEFLGGSGIFLGIFTGIFAGAFLIDKYQKRFLLLSINNFTAFSASFLLYLFMEGRISGQFNTFLGFILAFSIIFSGMLLLILFVVLTTIMERGRITSVVLILGAISIALFYFFLTLPITPVIPILLPAILGGYFLKISKEEKEQSNLMKTIEEESINELQDEPYNFEDNQIIPKVISIGKYRLIISNAKYYFIIMLYGFICGLIIPIDIVVRTFLIDKPLESLIIIAVISSLLILIGGVVIGFVFDYFGKKITLSVMILIISIANFLNIFSADSGSEINMAVISSFAVFVFFILTPLLLGDIGRKSQIGKMIALWIILGFSGLLGGYFFKINLLYSFIQNLNFDLLREFDDLNEIVYYNYSTTSVVFMACILLLFIVSFIKEEISIREYNWPSSLIKLYIIHDSGILLYEYNFKESEESIDSDLVSGGIVGLVSMLREITKENTRLKTIDHGTKKLIFRWDSTGKAIFVLMVEYESLIVRQKLSALVKSFEQTYKKLLEETEFKGVSTQDWASVKEMIEFYLTRKKFDFLGLKQLISYLEHTEQSNADSTAQEPKLIDKH